MPPTSRSPAPARIKSIDFARVSGGRGPIFAVSGQTSPGGNFTPVAVTGFNADIVVEASPAWPPYGIQSYTTASMDGGVANTGNTWNERGYYPQFPELRFAAGRHNYHQLEQERSSLSNACHLRWQQRGFCRFRPQQREFDAGQPDGLLRPLVPERYGQ